MAANDWLDDPQIQAQLRQRSVRNGILRTAIIWTPLFLVCLGLLLFFLFDVVTGGGRGTVFLLIVLALVTLLFGSQSLQSVIDLFSAPSTVEGVVTRRWAKMDSLVMRTHYVRIGKTILRGDQDLLDGVRVDDRVVVSYYRHSAVVLDVQMIEQAARPETAPRRRLSFRERK